MLSFPKSVKQNTVENINYRTTYITGKVVEDLGHGKYKVALAGNEDGYPDIYTIYSDPDYTVGETVGVLWEYGIREKPIIAGVLRNITYLEVSGSVNSLGG